MRNRLPRLGLFAVPAVMITLAIFSAGGQSPATVSIDGSSTVFPITEAVAEDFQRAHKVRVTVGISGTGGGFQKFCRGETDVQNASRPIQRVEMEACKKNGINYFELPVAYDALTVVVHPSNSWAAQMTVEELKKIWSPEAQGKITKWSQVREGWPEEPITLYGAGADSGTFDYFTEAIVGKAKSSRGDYTASEDDNTLVLGVSSDVHALGYIPFSYYDANKSKLKAVAIDGGAKSPTKKPVLPSPEAVVDGSYHPLSRPLFLYISGPSYKRSEVKEFAEFYMKNAASLAREVNFVGLEPKAYSLALQRLAGSRFGTAFGGSTDVGLSIQDMLSRATEL